MERVWNEWDYMSYNEDLGMYHTKRLKRYMLHLPEIFDGYNWLSKAESIIYLERGGRHFLCEPCGILSFKRGRHPTGMGCDDILKDPEAKLDLTQIEKITTIFHDQVINMPREDLHVVGTPQDQEDLFSKLAKNKKFNFKVYSAEAYPDKKKALWETHPDFNWVELMIKKANNIKSYMKEFLCLPVRSTDAFVSSEQYNKVVSSRLKNYDIARGPVLKRRNVVGGFDIGKKSHPSHFAIFVESRRKYKVVRINAKDGKKIETMEKRLFQIHSRFLDGWDYIDQVDYIKNAISVFKIGKIIYDNTRAEFESIDEAGNLPSEMKAVTFTSKEKFALAGEMDVALTQVGVKLINDDRQRRQIMSVDNDLKAPETDEGHGDAFWSIAMAIKAHRESNEILVWSPGDRRR